MTTRSPSTLRMTGASTGKCVQPSTSVSGAGSCAGREQVVEVAVHHRLDHRAVAPALLRQRDEQRAGPRDHRRLRQATVNRRLVCAATHRALGRDHRDAPGTRCCASRRCAGLHHAQHRHGRELGSQVVERHGGGGVARHHQALHAALAQQRRGLQRVAADRCGALRTVREPRRVAEVDEVLVRQRRRERAQHREPADAGIEHAHGRVRADVACRDRSARRATCGEEGRQG